MQNKFKRLEDLTKIQMTNSKLSSNTLFTGKTFYFNYREFLKELNKHGTNEHNPIIKSIKWRCQEYNKIVSCEIEKQMTVLRGY